MNISTQALTEAKARDGEAAEERPAYVDEALEQSRQIGWQNGLPLVEPEEYETPQLGEDNRELYSHYVGGSDLYRPDAGSFLATLFEQPEIDSVDDAAKELGPSTEKAELRKAAKLHGLEIPSGSEESAEQREDEGGIRLPSGETVPFGPLHPLVVAQLLSDGLSVEESARYLSAETGGNYTPSDVREAAQDANLLSGGDDGTTNLIPDRERTVTAGEGDVASTPW